MNNKKYSLPFRALSNGNHYFNYCVDSYFLSNYDNLDNIEGELDVSVVFIKEYDAQELKINLKGSLTIPCDRCLDQILLPFSVESKYYVRVGDKGEEENDDTILVATNQTTLDLTQILYEVIATSLPLHNVHDEGQCDKDMIKRLHKLEI